MAIGSPIWLIALVPWSALAIWLFQGRRPRALVPYLALWQSREPMPRPKKKLQVLPLAVLMALLAALCSIFAAARPSVASGHAVDGFGVTLIVDRGLTMSARSSGELRYAKAAGALVDAIPPGLRSAPIELVTVPGDEPVRTTFAECTSVLGKTSPSARDTSLLLPQIVSARLAAQGGPVIVISDKTLAPREHLIQVPPEGGIRDAGIALVAARQSPAPQVMVRVRNQSSLSRAELVVSSDAGSERQTIELPEPGRTRDYFFNPSGLGAVIEAQLEVSDDLSANNRAWLAREGNSPRIEPLTMLDPALRRLVDAYQRSRPASDESSRLVIVADAAQLPTGAPAILAPPAQGSPLSGPKQVVAHAITEHVAWEELPASVGVAAEPPAGWTALVSMGGHPILAVRPGVPRQVWVGFDARDWSRTPDFVVFWTNVFDWAGGGGARYVAHPLSDWTPQWKPTEPANTDPGMWPGLYRRSDGALRAFNAPDIALLSPAPTDWRAQLASLHASVGRLDLSGPLLVVVAGCLVIAAATWKSHRRLPSIARAAVP